MQLLLIRHALPVRLERPDGVADPELSGVGVAQARRLAEWVADERIDALYASPLRRARETAAPLAELVGLETTVVDGLAEWDRDSSAYIPIEELQAANDPVWQRLSGGRHEDLAELGIDPAEFRDRVVTTIDDLAAAHRGERIAVVCHGGVINAYLATVLGLDRLLFFSPDYTSISRVMIGAGVRSIGTLNETPHLR
ncbi:MAG: histidine phosphatase family protein [Acidimicrobiales bacterium]